MAELKTKATHASVDRFLQGIKDEKERQDCYELLAMMKKATKAEPKMWSTGIIGFGDHHYVYESGREGDWFLTGFSPRTQNLTLYVLSSFESQEELSARLGKHKTGKGCLYIKRLDDVDSKALQELITKSVRKSKATAK